MGGIGPSIISLLTIWLAFPTWGLIVYPKLTTFPAWAVVMANASNPVVQAVTPIAINASTALVNATLH